MGGYSQVDDWNPFGGAFLLLMLFALTYTFVCKYSAHRSEEVIRGHPERTSQVRGRGGSAQRGQSKATFIVTMTSWGDKVSPDYEGTSFMDAPLLRWP